MSDAATRIARMHLAREAIAATPRRWRFVIRHSGWFPHWAHVRALRALSAAQLEAEARLPRRYRRAIRGERMVPAK